MIVATYNIHGGVGLDGRRDVERIAAVVRELDADIVGLQEVLSPYDGAGEDQLGIIARETGLHPTHGGVMQRSDGHYGNALLTREPPHSVRPVDLCVAGREPRGAIDADVEVGLSSCRVIVTHLGLRGHERRWQTGRLLEVIAEPSPRPLVVVMGDLNEWGAPRGGRLWRVAEGFGTSAVRSFPSRWPMLALDRVLVRPAVALAQVHAHRSALARVASDHLPVRAVVRSLPDATT